MTTPPEVVKPITGFEATAPPGRGRFYTLYYRVYRRNVLETA